MRCLCGAKMEAVEKGRWVGWKDILGFGNWKRYWCVGKGHAIRVSVNRKGERVYQVVEGKNITMLPVGYSLVVWDEVPA